MARTIDHEKLNRRDNVRDRGGDRIGYDAVRRFAPESPHAPPGNRQMNTTSAW